MADAAANSAETAKAPQLVPYRFKPGQSGNPSGRPKKRLITDQLEKLLKQKDPKTGKPNAELVAMGLVKLLSQGKNVPELLNRLEGPVPQVQEITGKDGAALTITFTQAMPPEEPADE